MQGKASPGGVGAKQALTWVLGKPWSDCGCDGAREDHHSPGAGVQGRVV